MVVFKGQRSEKIQKDLATKRNLASGVKGIITLAFLVAPTMFLWLVALALLKGKDTIFTTDTNIGMFLGGALGLSVFCVLLAIKSFTQVIKPDKNVKANDDYIYETVVSDNSIKSVNRFFTIDAEFKKIKKIYKEEGYYYIYIKKAKAPVVLEESCVIEGNFSELETLFTRKISKKKRTNKAGEEKNNKYAIIGLVFSIILVASTIPLILLILNIFTQTVGFTIENILVPIGGKIWDLCFPWDELILNIVFGIVALPLFVIINVFIWGPVLVVEAGFFFLLYPSILCCSLVFPLKQLTVNKNKFAKFVIIFAICMIAASIGEIAIFAAIS